MATIKEIKKELGNNRFEKMRDLNAGKGNISNAFKDIFDNTLNDFKQRQEKIGSNKEILNFIMKEIEELFEKLFNQIKNLENQILKGDKGDMGNKPMAGIDYTLPKDGKSIDEFQVIQKVLTKIPLPKNGKDGLNADENKIIKKVLAKISPAKEIKLDAKEIRNKLQSLKEGEQLHASAIGGLISFIRTYTPQIRMGGGSGGGDTIRYFDLSSQLDG